jgi:hypothetical protein
MFSKRHFFELGLAAISTVAFLACADTDSKEPPTPDQELGTLSLTLTAADSDGRAYRLRQADFLIRGLTYYPPSDGGIAPDAGFGGDGGSNVEPGDGDAIAGDGDAAGDGDQSPNPGTPWGWNPYPGFSKVVSSETELGAASIVERVVPDYYAVQLLDSGWYLERLEDEEWTTVEQVVLLSERIQYVYVEHGYVAHVAYRFGVDGELIDFRSGEVEIGIEIEQPGEGHSTCEPWSGLPCPFPDAGIPVDSGHEPHDAGPPF